MQAPETGENTAKVGAKRSRDDSPDNTGHTEKSPAGCSSADVEMGAAHGRTSRRAADGDAGGRVAPYFLSKGEQYKISMDIW